MCFRTEKSTALYVSSFYISWNDNDLKIIIITGHNITDIDVSIQCSGNASGLAFIRCRNISIQDSNQSESSS